ncbi:uridylate kinase [Microdochium trichocladiopsis]|uniref:Uridylate kinase n=1 Tax=Microdochium trichocladiopsis TaxID=1682393 RepID=A0A9P9BT93_9PEZI|nr:uridylate kinase [Microdochium trichocladiopsis]KAH7035252.1 uridylate kinase [Microdochium trichocladiopsis]
MAASMQRMLWRQVTAKAAPASIKVSASASRFAAKTASASPAFSTCSSTTSRVLRNTAQRQPKFGNSSFRRTYSSEAPKGNKAAVKFWPFVLVIVAGSGGYALLVNKKADAMHAAKQNPQIGAPSKPTPAFSPDNVTVVFVLGGPGAGKGTQCANLVRDYGFTHLSAGDLLRAEQERPGSQFGELIKNYIKEGLIVPLEVTVALLENAMTAAIDPSGKGDVAGKKGKFLIDGFPRKFDQAIKFEEVVCPAKFVLFFDCPESEMEKRLLERGKTSGRADDNAESIRKRFRTFIETSMPVVDYYEKQNRVIKIDARPQPTEVYKKTQDALTARLGKDL